MTAPREAVARVEKALLDEGCGPGNSIHSWRCEHPDMYGPCDCVAEVARAAADAAVDALGLTAETGTHPKSVDDGPCNGRCRMVACNDDHRWHRLEWRRESRLVGPWTEAD